MSEREIRIVARAVARGDTKATTAQISVGFCMIYEEGPHVLLTIDATTDHSIEIALTPDQAKEVARRLSKGASNLRGREAEAREARAELFGL